MPINESSNNLRSDLTAEQQRRAQAAVYGLPEPEPAQDLSAEDVQRLRMILARHDAQTSPVREFDLNKPPRSETLAPGTPGANGPYQYQPFPRMLYDHRLRSTTIVRSQPQMEQALADGWRLDPYPSEPVEEGPEFDAAVEAEIAAVDAELKKKKK